MQTQQQQLEALIKQMEALKAENEALKLAKVKNLSLKVSKKGAVSLYGMGRWPVTLYGTQWERLLDKAEDIKAFLVEHKAELAVKGEDTTNPNAAE